MGTNSNNTHFNFIGIKNQTLKKKKKNSEKQKGSRCENYMQNTMGILYCLS